MWYKQVTNQSKLDFEISPEKRQLLSFFLGLSVLRPFDELTRANEHVALIGDALKKSGFEVRGNFSMRNKNPMTPFCEWRSKPFGIDVGYDSEMCDGFQPRGNEKGFCYSFNAEMESNLTAKVGVVNGFTFALDVNQLEPTREPLYGPGGTYPVRTTRELNMRNFEVHLYSLVFAPFYRLQPPHIQ